MRENQSNPQDSVCIATDAFSLRYVGSNMFGEIIMSSETAPNQADKYEQLDPATPELAEEIERIKQPPAMDDALMELSPEEMLSNPAVAPEMLNEGEGLRDDLRRD